MKARNKWIGIIMIIKKRQGSMFRCLIPLLTFFFIFTAGASAQEDTKGELFINFIAVNASEREAKTIEVKQYLPKELKVEDILDTGDLEPDYDVNKGMIYVHGDVQFGPKETKTYRIRVRDVWKVASAEIDLLRQQLDDTLSTLKDNPNYASAVYVRDKMNAQMDFILKQQNEFSGDVGRRIEEYRANLRTLEQIRDNVYSMDFLKYESKSIEEQDNFKQQITIRLEVKNPNESKAINVRHKHFLPEEIRAEHVIDSKGFEVRFDEKHDLAYLTKEEEFGPGEVKVYEIIVRDVWHFPEVKLQDLYERAQIATLELEGTTYGASATHLFNQVNENINLIRETTKQKVSTQKHIGYYRLNLQRFDKALKDFKRIEEMIAIVRAKKLEEFERKRVKNILQKLKALRGLKKLSEALLKKRLTPTLTWKIIGAVIVFVATFTLFHYIIWARRSARMGEELGLKPGEDIKVVPKPGEKEEEGS